MLGAQAFCTPSTMAPQPATALFETGPALCKPHKCEHREELVIEGQVNLKLQLSPGGALGRPSRQQQNSIQLTSKDAQDTEHLASGTLKMYLPRLESPFPIPPSIPLPKRLCGSLKRADGHDAGPGPRPTWGESRRARKPPFSVESGFLNSKSP